MTKEVEEKLSETLELLDDEIKTAKAKRTAEAEAKKVAEAAAAAALKPRSAMTRKEKVAFISANGSEKYLALPMK